MPTIHAQIAARHEAARITDEEDRRSPVLLRVAEFAQHVLGGPVTPALGVLLEERFHHGGDDVARGNGVDADAVGAPFGGEVAGELQYGRFGGVVGGADEALGGMLVCGT